MSEKETKKMYRIDDTTLTFSAGGRNISYDIEGKDINEIIEKHGKEIAFDAFCIGVIELIRKRANQMGFAKRKAANWEVQSFVNDFVIDFSMKKRQSNTVKASANAVYDFIKSKLSPEELEKIKEKLMNS